MNSRHHSDLVELRRGFSQVGTFRGYRAAPVAFSGVVGLAAGLTQVWLRPGPSGFVLLWSAAAFLGFGFNLLCIARSYGASPRRWERSLAFNALSDLFPAVLAGFFLTVAFTTRNLVDLLPGLWMILFGAGLMTSRRHLPLVGSLGGASYILAGTSTLLWLDGAVALRPEVMAGVFGLGQLVLSFALSKSEGIGR